MISHIDLILDGFKLELTRQRSKLMVTNSAAIDREPRVRWYFSDPRE